MMVVVVCPRPEWNPVVHREGEVVTRVSVNRLEETERYPDVDGEDVQVLGYCTVEEGAAYCTHTEDEDLERVSVFCCQTEGSRELVMLLVDVLVEGTPVQGTVCPVVEHVLEDEEAGDLDGDLGPVGEGDRVGCETKVLAERVEGPDLGELDGEVGEEDVAGGSGRATADERRG